MRWGYRSEDIQETIWEFDEQYEFVGLIMSRDTQDITNLGAITFGCRNENERVELLEFVPAQI